MYSAYKLKKQGDNIQPWHTPFPMWNQSVVPCPVLSLPASDRLTLTPLTPYWSHWSCLSAVDTFSGYSSVTPVWSAKSDHTFVALETTLLYVQLIKPCVSWWWFAFNLQSHSSWPVVKVSSGSSIFPIIHGIIQYCWLLEWLKKKDSKHFWWSLTSSWFTHLESGIVTG